MAALTAFTVAFNGYSIGVDNGTSDFVACSNINGLYDVTMRIPEVPYGGADGTFTPAADNDAWQESRLITIDFVIRKPSPGAAVAELRTAAAAFVNTGLQTATITLDGEAVTYSCVGKGLVHNLSRLHEGYISCQATILAPNPNEGGS